MTPSDLLAQIMFEVKEQSTKSQNTGFFSGTTGIGFCLLHYGILFNKPL